MARSFLERKGLLLLPFLLLLAFLVYCIVFRPQISGFFDYGSMGDVLHHIQSSDTSGSLLSGVWSMIGLGDTSGVSSSQNDHGHKDHGHKGHAQPESNGDRAYGETPVMNVDDYEYNLVFQNESPKELTIDTKNAITSAYPMDWSVQPPSSSIFQAGAAASAAAAQENSELAPVDETQYKSISGTTMIPADTYTTEMNERDILQQYKPTRSSTSTYDIIDAKQLIDKIYTAKGQVAEFVQRDDNVYEIIQTRKKGEAVQYEDEPKAGPAVASINPVREAGEGVIQVPVAAAIVDQGAGLDPFFSSNDSNRTKDGKIDYTRWTPGMERMFAPTEPRNHWY